MTVRGWRLGRLFGGAAVGALGCYSVVTLASAPVSVLAGNCSKSNPASDILVTQSAVGAYSGGVAQSVTFTITTENEGPCNATGINVSATVADTGVPQLTITTVSTNPSSGTCAPTVGASTGTGSISCAFAKLSAPSDANTNNPGTAVVVFTVTATSGNLGGLGAPPVTSVAVAAATAPANDPDPGNNTSRGVFLVDGGTFSYPGAQSTMVSVPTNQGLHGSAEIEQGVTDPNPPNGSFGQIVLINSDSFLDSSGNPAAPLQTVTFDIPITSGAPQSTSKVFVWHELDGTTTWVLVPACTKSATQPDPSPSCVFSISKLKSATGSYFEIVVYTTVTSKWIG